MLIDLIFSVIYAIYFIQLCWFHWFVDFMYCHVLPKPNQTWCLPDTGSTARCADSTERRHLDLHGCRPLQLYATSGRVPPPLQQESEDIIYTIFYKHLEISFSFHEIYTENLFSCQKLVGQLHMRTNKDQNGLKNT